MAVVTEVQSPIRKWRESLGIDQDALARLIEGYRGQPVEQPQVSFWERSCVMRLANAVMFERLSSGAVTRGAIAAHAAWWRKQQKKRKGKSRRAERAAYKVSIATGDMQRVVAEAIANDGVIDEGEARRIAAKCEAVRACANDVEASTKEPG